MNQTDMLPQHEFLAENPDVPAAEIKIAISYKQIPRLLLIISVILCLLSLALTAYEWNLGVNNTYWVVQFSELFGVTHEANIPTWFSSFLLLCAAILSGIIALADREQKLRWTIFSILFIYLALDETAVIHEMFTTPLRETLQLDGYLYFGWLIVGIPVVAVVTIAFIPFLIKLPSDTRNSVVLAGIVYIFGAVCIEAVSANQWYMNDGTSLHYSILSTLEEFMEMLGIIILINGLLRHIAKHFEKIALCFSP